jgi:uncharacterized membrane protein
MWKILFFILLLLFNFNFLTAKAQADLPDQSSFLEKGVVTSVLSRTHDKELEEVFDTEQIVQILNVKVLTGEFKNKEFKIKNYITSNPAYDVDVKTGDRVVLETNDQPDVDDIEVKNDNTEDINIIAKDNSGVMLVLIGLFLLSLLIVGGYKGMKALLSLGVSLFLVVFVLVPGILIGWHPIPATVFIAVIATILTSFISSGITIKSLTTSLGVTVTLVLAGIFSSLILSVATVNGIDSQEFIAILGEYPDLNFRGILSSGFIISTLGAVITIASNVSANINQIKIANPDAGYRYLFSSGLASTKELTGNMANTLIFAYLGNAIPLLILAFSTPFIKFINFNVVIAETTAAILGGVAIIFCTPITAAISAYFNKKYTQTKAS